MPSRWMIAAIVAFWLGAITLLVYREIVPRYLLDHAPAFRIDLLDDIGSSAVEWEVFDSTRKVGLSLSQIHRLEDRTFEFSNRLLLTDFKIGPFKVRKIENRFGVDKDGHLLAFSSRTVFALADDDKLMPIDMTVELQGEVKEGKLKPQLKAMGQEFDFNEVDMSNQGSILNPMQVLHRLPRLREGQTWSITLMDPMKFLPSNDLLGGFLGKTNAVPKLQAVVKRDLLSWQGHDEDVFKIEYSEPGKTVSASTWVRVRDSNVLQQWAAFKGFEFTLVRVPAK